MKSIRLAASLLFLFTCVLVFPLKEAELYSEAESYYRAGNYLLALDGYARFIQRFPLSDRVPDAQYRRGVSLFRLGRFRESLNVFEDIEKRHRATRYFDYIYFWRGLAHYRLGEQARAAEALGVFLAARRDPELTPQALLYKGQAQIALADFRSAARDLQILVQTYPESEPARHGLIALQYSYLQEGRYREVQELAALTTPEKLPEKSRSLFTLYTAESYWQDGRADRAEQLYAGLLEADQEVASVAYRRLFMAAGERGDLAGMESLVRQAERRFSGSPALLQALWVQVGVESFKQGKTDLSEYFLGKVFSLPDKKGLSETVPVYLAEGMIRKKQLDQAAGLLEEYMAANPKVADLSLLKLADVRLLQGDFATAGQIYAQYLAKYPDSPRSGDAVYFLAYCRYRLGDLGAALELASPQLPKASDPALRRDLYRLVIVAHKARGEQKEALARLREYIDLYPEDLGARIDALKVLFGLKDYGGIVSDSNRLRQEYPDLERRSLYAHLLASYLRGLAEISRKRYGAALEALEVISQTKAEQAGLASIWPYTLYYQGWAHYRNGSYAEARKRVILLLESQPNHPLFSESLFLAGWTSFSLGDYRAAAGYFARLAKTGSAQSDKAAFLQARSVLSLRNLEEAATLFRSHYSARPASAYADDALLEHAGILVELGRTAEAAAAYQELARKYPESPLAEEALYKRGEVFRSGGDNLKAKEAFYEYRSRFPRGRLVDASLYWGGLAAYDLGERFEAVLHWERLMDNYPLSPFRPDALRRSAEAYAQRGDYRKAIELYTSLAGQYPEEARVYSAAQRIDELRYLLQGLSDREALLSRIIGQEGGAKSAKGREAMIELSRLYLYEGSGRMELAYQMLSSVVEKAEPVSASQAQFLVGEYYYRKSQPVQAAREFLKAGYLNPQDKDQMAASIYRAAEMMHLAGNTADVRELVGRLEQHFPGSQWTLEAKKLLEGGRK